ncbi:hypothetical protein ENSA7_62930 [Enhygromyxa salina]|uniref:Uncharacterized protein n=1 Tax=Enhygromyxa salina TaxID=215803 RepID=A0A2S9Y3H3_9BACT|nr:hypothetical protein ENSA7_62930 [Enhygromyxa salina]
MAEVFLHKVSFVGTDCFGVHPLRGPRSVWFWVACDSSQKDQAEGSWRSWHSSRYIAQPPAQFNLIGWADEHPERAVARCPRFPRGRSSEYGRLARA